MPKMIPQTTIKMIPQTTMKKLPLMTMMKLPLMTMELGVKTRLHQMKILTIVEAVLSYTAAMKLW